jgi:hypothetical protein
MTRSRLALLLLLTVCVAGCSQSSAVSSLPEATLPAKSPERHTVEKVVVSEASSATIPPVCLSTLHAKWCVAKVGDAFPDIELPQLNGQSVKLSTLYGKRATVVLYWSADRWMSRMALEDLVSFVAGEHDPQQVAIVGIAVRQPAAAARRRLNQTKVIFPQLLHTNATALAHVGSVALPRLYVLEPTGNIVWFDIEYSESTRRELAQTLRVLTGDAE